MSLVSRLEERSLDPAKELAALIGQAAGAGAVVSFTGVARAKSKTGQAVDELLLEHHPVLTSKSLEEIAADTIKRFEVDSVRIVHRSGRIEPGEPIVFAGAASAHRRAAFDAADYLMDRLKTEAVLWKREVGRAGSTWIEPSDADHADRERWG